MIHDRTAAASQTPHPCGQCQFYQGSVWTPVDPRAAATLAERFFRRELEADQVLFEQGADNQGVFCVSRGLIALRTHHADGTSTLLKLAYPGEVIGFRSFLDNGIHKTEARALMSSRVCTVARRDAERVVRASPGIMERLAARCVAEIDRSQQRIIATATTSNKDRLAATLMELIARHGEADGAVIRARLPLSRKDLADLIGVPPETLSRLVGRLGKEGYFTFSGREVSIPRAEGGTA